MLAKNNGDNNGEIQQKRKSKIGINSGNRLLLHIEQAKGSRQIKFEKI